MTGFVIFKVGKNQYAVNIEMIQRIVQAEAVTVIPNSHRYIDGMVTYENKVLKVVNFRKLSHVPSYEQEISALFDLLKNQHGSWMQKLQESVEDSRIPFTEESDPRMCKLGKWLAAFNSADEHVNAILRDLNVYHNALHRSALSVLDRTQLSSEKALTFFTTDIKKLYEKTIYHLEQLGQEVETVADSMQKFLIVRSEQPFIIKVDAIIDIAYVDESKINRADSVTTAEEFLCIEGILDNKGTLVNVIKSVELPRYKEQ